MSYKDHTGVSPERLQELLSKTRSRAEAAEQRVKELEEALREIEREAYRFSTDARGQRERIAAIVHRALAGLEES